MADAGGAGGRLPQTFGEKLSFAAPVLLATLAVSVLVAFVLVWVINGQLRDEFEKKTQDIEAKAKATKDELTEEQKRTKELTKRADELTDSNKKLVEQLLTGPSKKIRNTVAGYVTRIMQRKEE